MPLADFLGNLGTAMAGGGQMAGSALGQATGGAPMPVPQQPQKRESGLRRFLGNLGDALLVGSGGEPIYGPTIERREMGEALASYVGDTDAQLAEIMRRDPATGFAMLKLKMDSMPDPVEPQDPTALMQNMEYLRRLNPALTPDTLAEITQYAIAAPRMYGSPEMGWSPDPNYPFGPDRDDTPAAPGGVQEGATATNPQTGERITFRNGAWVPLQGDAGGNASGGFPGN